ncbi:MAG: hypothetical protein V1833_04260, partial [Elusimicrobiota bacterium]
MKTNRKWVLLLTLYFSLFNLYSPLSAAVRTTFAMPADNSLGVGTMNPGAKFEVVGGSSTFRSLDTLKDIAAFGSASGDFKV